MSMPFSSLMPRSHQHIQPRYFDIVAGRAVTPTQSFEEACVRAEAERQRAQGRLAEWCAEYGYPVGLFAQDGQVAA